MIRLATQSQARVFVSDYEATRDTPNWTIHTAAFFKDQYPHDRLYWVIGSDNYSQFHTWRSYQRLLRMLTLLVISRDATYPRNTALSAAEQAAIIHCPVRPYILSATAIRTHQAPLETSVHPTVSQYSRDLGLYSYGQIQ